MLSVPKRSICDRPRPNPLLTSSVAEPPIVSTKNQRSVLKAKVARYLASTILLAPIIARNPNEGRLGVKPRIVE